MSRIEILDATNLQEFIDSATAVLILAKTTCENCAKWSAELDSALASDEEFSSVRFGKVYLDKPGLIKFKKANPWLAEVDVLPFNLIYRSGDKKKAWAGGGFDRLTNRLRRLNSPQ